jgi:hypothetical protein
MVMGPDTSWTPTYWHPVGTVVVVDVVVVGTVVVVDVVVVGTVVVVDVVVVGTVVVVTSTTLASALAVLEPTANMSNVNVFTLGVVLAGRVTSAVADPEAQPTTTGSPARPTLVDENTHLVAFLTWAVSVTTPPGEDTVAGSAVKDATVGGAWAAAEGPVEAKPRALNAKVAASATIPWANLESRLILTPLQPPSW